MLVHIDGGASDSACSFWTVEGAVPRLLHSGWNDLKDEVNFFNTSVVGHLALGLAPGDHLSMPGKLMGFAAFGDPRPELVTWLDRHNWFIGFPGGPDGLAQVLRDEFRYSEPLDTHSKLLQELCACLQQRFQTRILDRVLEFQCVTGAKHLIYAGGAALNIATNVLLERSGAFESVCVPPCANDTGLALGAAAWLEYRDRGHLPLHSPFLHTLDAASTEPPLDAVGAVAELIVAGRVVGLCNGAGEVGPRALGHRSIVARADSVDLRRHVSEVIKRREWYRPIAPVVCEEVARQAFDAEVLGSQLAPLMLGAYPVRDTWRPHFAGVLHDDGTVRVQVVRDAEPDQAFLRALLQRLWREHGLAALINTSFNRQGQPILQRHSDAVAAAAELGLDAVVVHGVLHKV